ncbi:hypothetical protein LMG33818_002245 [Halomonadaceae bacterium LMG 33818]|uniref:MetQ/NlpA family ABC transporter substrate-binding protein n=1 Tax=Cernens ardua TaxID=3402176 RepID=UPI003EDC0732
MTTIKSSNLDGLSSAKKGLLRPALWRTIATVCTVAFVLAGCHSGDHEGHSNDTSSNNTHLIRMGFVPGPYRQEFEEGIAPQLKKEGYTIRYQEFADGIACNDALAHGEIDANIMQHPTYLASTNAQNGTHLKAIVEVPTPPMGLFSQKHPGPQNADGSPKKGVLTPPQNAQIAVPDTAVNLLRALRILHRIGWIDYNKQAKPDSISPRDVTANPYHLKFVQLDASQGPRALPDVDYAAIQGNFVISAGLKLSSALALEQRDPAFINVVAVNQPSLHKPFVKAIVDAYHSPFFKQKIEANPEFKGYIPPQYFSATSHDS